MQGTINVNDLQLIPFNPDKPTILLLSDDLNAPSGIGTAAKSFVFGTVDRFNWIQVAAAIKHPDTGKILDISSAVAEVTGVEDANVKLYPYDGYGDQNLIRYILQNEKVDAILHFTDPRFWIWLYDMEYELHTTFKVPLMYYSIWDNLPYPFWNFPYYASCDLIMGISKQSHIIHQQVLAYGKRETLDITDKTADDVEVFEGTPPVLLSYVPHGIDRQEYRPILEIGDKDPDYAEFIKFKKEFAEKNSAKFVVFWNNRNIARKMGSTVILAFKEFVDSLDPAERSGCVLLMHTDPVDHNGTDLYAVHEMLAPECRVIFSSNKIDKRGMNFYYNLADVTINIANNEGFGLSSAESIMAGTMVINNVTGGLQDQMRFVEDESPDTVFKPTSKIPSNHCANCLGCGDWAIPVFPENRSLNGSVATPYILDDRCGILDIAEAILTAYSIDPEVRYANGLAGREWMLSNESKMSATAMADGIANGILTCLKTFKPKNKYSLEKVETRKKLDTGIIF